MLPPLASMRSTNMPSGQPAPWWRLLCCSRKACRCAVSPLRSLNAHRTLSNQLACSGQANTTGVMPSKWPGWAPRPPGNQSAPSPPLIATSGEALFIRGSAPCIHVSILAHFIHERPDVFFPAIELGFRTGDEKDCRHLWMARNQEGLLAFREDRDVQRQKRNSFGFLAVTCQTSSRLPKYTTRYRPLLESRRSRFSLTCCRRVSDKAICDAGRVEHHETDGLPY